jgi:hypothetical protein
VADGQRASEDDFLARERAALGQDADQFATPQDHVGDDENINAGNDLLSGDDGEPVEEIGQFESSFPSMETQAQNEVWNRHWLSHDNITVADQGFIYSARCPWWYHYWLRLSLPPYWLPEHSE